MTKGNRADSAVFRQALEEDAKARAGKHPELDALVAYLTDELDPEADERIRDHLAACRECATTVLDLKPLVMPEATPEGVADLELEATWQKLQMRVKPREKGSRSPGVPRWTAALAASLLVTVVGLSAWVNQLRQSNSEFRRQVAELSQPEVNPTVAYLSGTTRSEDPGDELVAISPSDPFVFLFLVSLGSYPDYEVELTDVSGRPLWSGAGLQLSESGTLRLRLPRRMFPEGDYLVRAYGVAGPQRDLVIDRRVRVRYP